MTTEAKEERSVDNAATNAATDGATKQEGEASGGVKVAEGDVMSGLGAETVAELEAASASVAALAGQKGVATFRKAMILTLSVGEGGAGESGGEEEGERLREATALFVELLSGVEENRQGEAGFGELLLGYGKALVGFVRRSQMGQGVLGDAVEKKEEVEEDIGEEDDEEELAWTQLETARVVFEKLGDGYKKRLGEVHATLGDLLLESDEWEGAGREFGSAGGLLEGRGKAEALYKRYLALRRDKADEAVKALKESVETYEKVEGVDEATLKELRGELEGFERAVLPAMQQVAKEREEKVQVTVVQPRKRQKKET